MDHHRHLSPEQAKSARGFFIINFIHILDFEEMVAGAECPLLGTAPLIGLLTYQIRVSTFNAPAGLYLFQVRGLAVAALDRPLRAFDKEPSLILRAEPYLAF